MKNSINIIENRTRDLPARNAVTQPTALPRTPHLIKGTIIRGVMGFVFKVMSVTFPLHIHVCVCVYKRLMLATSVLPLFMLASGPSLVVVPNNFRIWQSW
jgi:hypothetical protein